MKNETRILYRFTSPFASFSMTFENDDAAFTYADEMVDGPQMVKVERFSNSGDWFVWNVAKGQWIYDSTANSSKTREKCCIDHYGRF